VGVLRSFLKFLVGGREFWGALRGGGSGALFVIVGGSGFGGGCRVFSKSFSGWGGGVVLFFEQSVLEDGGCWRRLARHNKIVGGVFFCGCGRFFASLGGVEV